MTTEVNKLLAAFYERDLRQMIDEINLFQNEEDLWKTTGGVKNPAGNLALHIAGGLKFFVGTNIVKNGYVRNRDLEFTQRGVPRKEIVAHLEEVILLVNKTLNGFTTGQMESEFPVIYDGEKRSHGYVLIRLLAHLGYHLGQVNYLRRILEP